ALKVIKSEFSRDKDIQKRFLREARALANVKSDHVVTIHQVGQHNENCFIAMELLEGKPLSQLLETEGQLPVRETLRIAGQVAQALAAVHARGFVHRDVKPDNVWIEAGSRRAKLLDFGLVRPEKDNVQLTNAGIIMGTPAYMSPEQARADAVDERSDLFSLGCVLYEMATGHRPFAAKPVMAILWALAVETPEPPSKSNSSIPAALNDLILRLLAKEPADRPKSAQEVIAQLEAIQVANQGNAVSAAQPASTSVWLRSPDAGKAPSRSGETASLSSPTSSQSIRAREAERRQVTVLVCSCDVFE